MHLKIFGKEACAKCQTTKNKLNHFLSKWELTDLVKLTFFDMNSIDGMAEGSFMDVSEVPTIILENEGKVLTRWNNEIPNSKELKEHLEKICTIK